MEFLEGKMRGFIPDQREKAKGHLPCCPALQPWRQLGRETEQVEGEFCSGVGWGGLGTQLLASHLPVLSSPVVMYLIILYLCKS